MAVFFSNQNIHVQFIDDSKGMHAGGVVYLCKNRLPIGTNFRPM
jgi:ribosomal protein L18